MEHWNNAVETLYSEMMDKPREVLEIISDFYGEDRVDMQGFPTLQEFKNYLSSTPIGEYLPLTVVNLDSRLNMSKPLSQQEVEDGVRDRLLVMKRAFHNLFKGSVLIYFPQVRVTNENNRFHDIYELYVKVSIDSLGQMTGFPALNRAEYTLGELNENYMHSHVCQIPVEDITEFQVPCFGDGPIRGTISRLNTAFDSEIWTLFCLELQKYVETESVSGGPFHYLEHLGDIGRKEDIPSTVSFDTPCFEHPIGVMLSSFSEYLLRQRKLKFSYTAHSYTLGMSLLDFRILVSNEFISWYNRLKASPEGTGALSLPVLLRNGILYKGIVKNASFYLLNNNRVVNPRDIAGLRMCSFKGKDVCIRIRESEGQTENHAILLSVPIVLYLLTRILKIVNYYYENPTQQPDISSGAEAHGAEIKAAII